MGPKGVAVDRNGHIIVVDNKACCVFIFQANGKMVTKFGNRGNGDRQFAGILGDKTLSCMTKPVSEQNHSECFLADSSSSLHEVQLQTDHTDQH